MIKRYATSAFLCAAILGASAGSAFADRAPNADERMRIEQTLRDAGYVSWEEIELDDGVWEVDDARKVANGQDCDIDISPNAYRIVKVDC